MNGKTLLLMAILGATCTGWIYRPSTEESKQVIGQTERVEIAEAALELLGRVDTGAATTSVHAESIQIDGAMVSFALLDQDDRRVFLRQPIAKIGNVRNAERNEERVYVELTLHHAGFTKRVLVNLNDRSSLTYPLLLGRNWLKDDFVVDVSRAPLNSSSDSTGGVQELPRLASQ